MTNLEKFERVFGIKLDPFEVRYTDFPCECVDVDFCDKYQGKCDEPGGCPAKNFWDKEYVKKEDRRDKMANNDPITGYKALDDALNSISSDELDRMLKAESERRKNSEKGASNHEFSDAIAQAALGMFGIDLKKGEE